MELQCLEKLDKNSFENSEPLCKCVNTWVLVVHNDFKEIETYERNGNEVDVENLKRIFQIERGCKFAELINCNKERIITTLSEQDKLIKLFYPNNADCKYSTIIWEHWEPYDINIWFDLYSVQCSLCTRGFLFVRFVTWRVWRQNFNRSL